VQLDQQQPREGGLTPAELHRWQARKQFLSLHFAPDRPAKVADTRDSVRVPTPLEVSFASNHGRAGCLMIHISRGGMFVQTDHPLALKSRFTPNLHVDSCEARPLGSGGSGFGGDRAWVRAQ
jgi:hypothetical protein